MSAIKSAMYHKTLNTASVVSENDEEHAWWETTLMSWHSILSCSLKANQLRDAEICLAKKKKKIPKSASVQAQRCDII